MKLKNPPRQYHFAYEIERNGDIERAFRFSHKRNRDVEIGEGRLILTDETTGERYDLFIDDGVLGVRKSDTVDATVTVVARLS